MPEIQRVEVTVPLFFLGFGVRVRWTIVGRSSGKISNFVAFKSYVTFTFYCSDNPRVMSCLQMRCH